MPVTISRGDRKLLYIAIAIVVVLVVTLSLVTPRDESEGPPSSYSTRKGGAKAAYLLLEQSGYQIERWEKPPAQLPVNPRNELLIIAGPTQYPDQNESNDLRKFVTAGGTLLLTGVWDNDFAPESHISFSDYRSGWGECKPALPSRIARGGPISMKGPLAWEKSRRLETLVHYTCKDDSVVVSYMVGRGQVIWWASSLPLTNQGIRDKNNLNLLINSLGDGKHILWDEYFQGAEKRTMAVFPPAVKWALLAQSLGFAAMLLITFSRRSGPVIPPVAVSRLSPLEFVDTLGNLYQRAAAAQVPVEIAFTRFRQLAARRLGLSSAINAQQLAQAMRQRRLVSDADFSAHLQRAEQAISDPSITEKEALALVQFLNRAAESLELTTAVPQEKRNVGDKTGAESLPK